MRNLDFTNEEVAAIVEYSATPDMFGETRDSALTGLELAMLNKKEYTLGLVIKSRRVLALIEVLKVQQDEDRDRDLRKMLNHYVTRPELFPIEDSVEFSANITFALFKALEKKGILTDADLKDALSNCAELEVL